MRLSTSRYRLVLWAGLGAVLLVFYVTFEVAKPLYDPASTLLIVLLGAFLAASWTFERSGLRNNGFLRNPAVSKIREAFVPLLALTLLALLTDVALTLYAIDTFGPGVELNRVVVGLLARGALSAWLGQQFGPVVLTGILFGLVESRYARTIFSFFVLGTLGYSIFTVLNDLVVIRSLLGA